MLLFNKTNNIHLILVPPPHGPGLKMPPGSERNESYLEFEQATAGILVSIYQIQ